MAVMQDKSAKYSAAFFDGITALFCGKDKNIFNVRERIGGAESRKNDGELVSGTWSGI